MEYSNIENQIDEIVKSCINYRFATELHVVTNEERKKILQKIIPVKNEESENQNLARDKLNKLCEEIDKCALHKSWSKLSVSQKQNRLEEYLKRIDNMTAHKKILKMLEEKKLKQAYVDYDPKVGVIKSLNIPEKSEKTKS